MQATRPNPSEMMSNLTIVCEVDSFNKEFQRLDREAAPLKTGWDYVYVVTSIALTVLAVYAYQKVSLYAALGLGALSLLCFAWSYTRTPSRYEPLAQRMKTATEDLQKAWAVKSNVICRSFNNNIALNPQVKDREAAMYAVNTLENDYSNIKSTDNQLSVTEDQTAWRNCHQEMVEKVTDLTQIDMIKFSTNENYHPMLRKLFPSLHAAAIRLVHGQCPAIPESTYVEIISGQPFKARPWGSAQA